MFEVIWISHISVVLIFAVEICVSNALSTGFLVLGGSSLSDPSNNMTHFLSLPTETVAGHTKVYTNTSSRWLHYKDFLEQPMSIDVDYTRKQLYVYNSYTATLQNFQFDPENDVRNLTFNILHSGLSRGHVKIAVDWISNNLYWTDPTLRWIALQSLQNHGEYKILIHDSGERPTGIAVDPIRKYLFWSDVGSLPKIERSSLTGTDRKTIVSQGIAYPIALDVDIASSKLYWVDSERDTVERSKLDGSERTTIRRMLYSTFFDIDVFAGVIFVIDINLSGKVRLFNTDSGEVDRSSPLLEYDLLEITCVAFYAPVPVSTDHCANNSCESICVSESTGPVCLCREGFVLNSDGRTCSEASGSLHRALVWSNATAICAADIRGLHDELKYVQANKTCLYNTGSQINWLTIDSHDRKAIFADGSDIYSMTLDGVHTKQRITSATETVNGLAVDWGDQNVYWCQGQSSATGKINVFSQTTKSVFTLISRGLDTPRALNILPLLSTMIWINGRQGGYQIKKAHIQGTDIQTIVSWTVLSEPKDLTVDADTYRLYFIDGSSLKYVQLDGSGLTTIIKSLDTTILPLKIHSYKNHLLVADSGIKIDVLSLTDSGSVTRSLDTVKAVTDISVIDITDQPEQNGPCDVNNGGCEQICLRLGRNRICQCSYGFTLDDNTETCSSEPLTDNFVYVSDWTHDKIYQVSLIDDDVRALDVPKVTDPTGVLYDTKAQRIIWGDTKNQYIQSALINGKGYTVLVDVGEYCAQPDRMTLDYSTGNIYYTAVRTCDGPKLFTGIGVVTPDGLHRQLISSTWPRAIAFDPVKGVLFWTDLGNSNFGIPPTLKRANTDGTNIVTLYTSMTWPNGVAIDTIESALYVTDGKTNIIYRCGYEANTCVQYHEDPGAHLMDIKLLGNYLYYTAWNKVYITKLHKTNKTDTARVANNAELGRLDSLSLYSSGLQTTNVSTLCSRNNGRGECSTFCHPTQNSFTCGCPDGEQLLQDGKTCPSAVTTDTTIAPSTAATTKTTLTSTPATFSSITTILYTYVSTADATTGTKASTQKPNTPTTTAPMIQTSSTTSATSPVTTQASTINTYTPFTSATPRETTPKTFATSSMPTSTNKTEEFTTKATTSGTSTKDDTTPRIGLINEKDVKDSSTSSSIMYIGSGVGVTLAVVIVVFAGIILYKRCGRQPATPSFEGNLSYDFCNVGFDAGATENNRPYQRLCSRNGSNPEVAENMSNEHTYNTLFAGSGEPDYATIDDVPNRNSAALASTAPPYP